MQEVQAWLGPLAAVASVAWGIIVYLITARKAEIAALGKKIEALEGDIEKYKVAGQASREELREMFHGVSLEVSNIRGDLKAQGETMKAVAATAQRVEKFLLESGKAR